jgi:nitroreductase
MEFYDVIRKRYSVRSYKPDPIEEDKLQRVLEAVQMAPTAADRQPFSLVMVRTTGKQDTLRRIYDREWFTQAPFLICACGMPDQAWVHRNGKNHYEIDVTIVMDHLTLAAANEGLGTCWIAAFDVDAARSILKLPDHIVPVMFTPLGYPADMPMPKERKAIDELVRYDHW